MGSDVEAQCNSIRREQRGVGEDSILHLACSLRLIETLQRLSLYPMSMDWISDRTRVLWYRNGYIKVLVERERINKLINKRLYKYLKQKV